jgi:hypothetical protein
MRTKKASKTKNILHKREEIYFPFMIPTMKLLKSLYSHTVSALDPF